VNISTHILDLSNGAPASGVSVKLLKQNGSALQEIASGTTNADGRHTFALPKESGQYQISFHVESYLQKISKDYFYTTVPVTFKIESTERNYHIPLLISPFGYSTYRGS
jgi:5-hydroxyisourate hydrolase